MKREGERYKERVQTEENGKRKREKEDRWLEGERVNKRKERRRRKKEERVFN